MAREKYIITSDCRIDNKHTPKGSVIELDKEDPREADKIGLLHRAGRLGVWTKRNFEFIQDEIAREKKERDQREADRVRAATDDQRILGRLAKLLQLQST